MAEPAPSYPSAAGFLLVVAIFAGTIGGLMLGQPSAGLLIGVAVGTGIAVALWLRERKRIGR